MPPTNAANATRAVADFDELYPNRFLKAGQLKGQKVTLTIASVHSEELEGETGKKWRGVMTFAGKDAQLVLNRTNGECLKSMFGRTVKDWIGKRITLFASEWNGEPCIRIWGSPDIDRDKTISIQLPRRKPTQMVMHATGKVNGGAGPNMERGTDKATRTRHVAPAAPPAHDPDTGEVHSDPEPPLTFDADDPEMF
jgi:hypothetical protein